jgi:hypothetical protein
MLERRASTIQSEHGSALWESCRGQLFVEDIPVTRERIERFLNVQMFDRQLVSKLHGIMQRQQPPRREGSRLHCLLYSDEEEVLCKGQPLRQDW